MENRNSHARASMDVLAIMNGAAVAAPIPALGPVARHRREKPVSAPPAAVAPEQVRSHPVALAAAAAPAPAQSLTPALAQPPADVVAAPSPATPDPTPATADSRPPFEITFPQRKGPQRVAGLAFLCVAPLAAGAGWQAWQSGQSTWIGVAAILTALSLALWVIRVTSRPARVSMRAGILTVTQRDDERAWDLRTNRSPVAEVHGRPGRPGWRVLLQCVDGKLVRVDASMVPPVAFMEMLRAYRPEL